MHPRLLKTGGSDIVDLVSRRRAVFPAFAGAVECAVGPVDEDALIAAVAAGAAADDVVPQLAQPRDRRLADAAFDRDGAAAWVGRLARRLGAAGVAHAGRVAGGLRVHAEIDQVH